MLYSLPQTAVIMAVDVGAVFMELRPSDASFSDEVQPVYRLTHDLWEIQEVRHRWCVDSKCVVWFDVCREP